jgi:hypothetical protein
MVRPYHEISGSGGTYGAGSQGQVADRIDSGAPISNTHLAQHPFRHCGLATVARAQ